MGRLGGGRYGKASAVQSGFSARLGRWVNAADAPQALAALLGVFVAVGVFQVAIDWTLLAADAAYWRDPPAVLARALAVAEALAADPWSLPLAAADRLRVPQPALAIDAGAAPWTIIVVKALGLDGRINVIGLQWALAWVLQPLSMIVLLRAAGAQRWATWSGGAVLSLLAPIWLSQQTQSGPAFASHFLIILAVTLSINCARHGLSGRRVLGFCGLGAGAAGFCLPHLTVVAAMLLAAMGAEIAQRRPGGWARVGDAALRFMLAVGVTGFMLGIGKDGPWIAGGAVYPGAAVVMLGLGGAWLWRGGGRLDLGWWRRFGPLATALGALVIIGVSGANLDGTGAARFNLQSGGLEAAVYVAVALSLLSLERVPPIWNAAMLVVAVMLQTLDVLSLLAGLRPEAPEMPVLSSEQSSNLAGRAFIFEASCRPPAEEKAIFERLTLVIVRTHGFIDHRRACPPARRALSPAAPLDPRIEVFPSQFADSNLADVSALRGDCRPSGQVTLCGRNLDEATSELKAAQTVEFTGGRTAGLTVGWSGPEPQGVWSAQKLVGLMIRAPIFAPEGMIIELEGYGYKPASRDSQRVIVSHEGTRLAFLEIGPAPGAYRVVVPPRMARPGQAFALEFFIIDAVPVSVIAPGSSDQRELGLNLRRIRLLPLASGAS